MMIKEEVIHCHIAQYLNMVIKPPNRWCTIEVSNQQAGRAGMFKQIALKKKGVVTGWPDIQIFWEQCHPCGTSDYDTPKERIIYKHSGLFKMIFLEIKTAKGRLTAKQKVLHEELRNEGHSVHVVRSVDDVQEVLTEVGII